MSKLMNEIRAALLSLGTLGETEGASGHRLVLALMMLMCDPDELVRQKASWHLGETLAAFEPDELDNHLRRLLWRLNPESGDHPFGVPEVIGEIGARISERVAPFLPAFVQCADDEKLLPGLLQALGRIGFAAPGVVADYTGLISRALRHDRPVVFGNAALALLRINPDRTRGILENDHRIIRAFCNNGYHKMKLRELAQGNCGDLARLCFISWEQ